MQVIAKRASSRFYLWWQRCLSSNSHKSDHGAPKKPVLTLFTKDVCPLCEKAKLEIADFLPHVEFQIVDIEKDPELYSKYKYDIPVFHLNGKFLFKHRANKEVLGKALRALSAV
ncbi:glutaredoxin-like protein C5orf63 homolog [Varroa jacobsoni]|uniref:Glutaredoxin-like protein n=1 Tax=Varroa destructor TaxID=109461 RepID=A0A7M7JPV3_VARDE|nr:glutaredoxin-like protein C5orf63 homolog [Varroa destructor]XP_022695233.1 glutaredoxin-like protein C5orf63 homolog [Varroa jacobsoni]